MSSVWSAAEIPDQTGRVAVVTGANSGLGLETARQLAVHGATVVLACRSLERGAAAIADIQMGAPDARLQLQELDLASLQSVRRAADALRAAHDRIDLLHQIAAGCRSPDSGRFTTARRSRRAG